MLNLAGDQVVMLPTVNNRKPSGEREPGGDLRIDTSGLPPL